ncbi:MAG: TatD family hydrolase [Patescibacteria group bacterium]
MFIDVHSHVQLHAFAEDWREVVDRSLSEEVRMIAVGTQFATSRRAVEIAQMPEYRGKVFSAVGFHPTHVGHQEWDKARLRVLAQEPTVVAIGECGMDYYRVDASGDALEQLKEQQKQVLRDHWEVARDRNLPVITHCREAYEDLLALIHQDGQDVRGVIHCFVGNWDTAQRFLDFGYMVSFTGIITFTDDEHLLEVVRNVPLDRLMVETDAPFLAPVPQRGKRNEPRFVRHVAERVAELKGISVEEVAKATVENSKNFFHLSF